MRTRLVRALPLVLLLGVGCAVQTESASTEDVSESTLQSAPMANFQKVQKGLYRGGHPDGNGIAYLKKIGVKTIVDLEIADFIEATPWSITGELGEASSAGITVLRYPMSAFEPALSGRFDGQMDDIMAVLADPSRRPIYVHCKHGQDRTGLVIGLERVENEKWTPLKAHDEMLALGFHTIFIGLDEYFERRTGWSD